MTRRKQLAPVALSEPELEAFPELTVLADRDNDIWQKRGNEWCSWETSPHSSTRLKRFGPFRILDVPEPKK